MKIFSTNIAGVSLIEGMTFRDERGDFQRMFCTRALEPALQGRSVRQINRSLTHRPGTVRGLHYQRSPHQECKIIHCVRGEVFDVAVDLRQDSVTFGHWFGQRLRAGEGLSLLVPEGCAHGFQALSADSELVYISTAYYEGEAEGIVHAQDADLAIDWPLPVSGLSAKDGVAKGLHETARL